MSVSCRYCMSSKSTLKRKTINQNKPENQNRNQNRKHHKSSKQVIFDPTVSHMTPEWSTYPTPVKDMIPPYPTFIPRTGRQIGQNVNVNQNKSNKNARFAVLYATDNGTSVARLKELVEQPYAVYYSDFIKGSITSKELYNKMKEAEEYLLLKYPVENASTPIYFDNVVDDYKTDTERNKIYTIMIRHYAKYGRMNGGRRTTHKQKQRKH